VLVRVFELLREFVRKPDVPDLLRDSADVVLDALDRDRDGAVARCQDDEASPRVAV
jgi:hypothetical protein